MANYEIYENYTYDENVRKLENTDPASADGTFNPLFSQLVNNTHSLKLEQDSINSTIQNSKVEIVDNLESTSADSALSANQGRILDEKIDSAKVEVINNLESTNTDTALSAYQGKVLDEKITSQNTTLTSAIESAKTTVVNSLTSTSTDSALSAYQGKVLDDKITGNPAQWGTGTKSVITGSNNTASGGYSSAFGYNNTASGSSSSAVGYGNTASSSNVSSAVGYGNKASGVASSAFGYSNEATGNSSSAVGRNNTASNTSSGAFGHDNTASGSSSNAVGYSNEASGVVSNAFGQSNTASGSNVSSAFGYNNTASGSGSSAVGYGNKASGVASSAFGYNATVDTAYCTTIGRWNVVTNGSATTYSTSSDGFVVGIGTSTSDSKNGLRITNSGLVYGGTYYNSGADYAEYFEWIDGNADNIDRIGLFVCIEDGKIKLAESQNDNIIGAISGGTCSIIGDAQADEWQGKYSRDIFGRLEHEWIDVEHEVITGIDDDGNEIIEKEVKQEYHMKLNPLYDPETPYIPRSERQEWDVVGLLGKLILIDDGTCSVGDYCTATSGGIATKSQDNNGFLVLERLDDSHIKILKI